MSGDPVEQELQRARALWRSAAILASNPSLRQDREREFSEAIRSSTPDVLLRTLAISMAEPSSHLDAAREAITAHLDWQNASRQVDALVRLDQSIAGLLGGIENLRAVAEEQSKTIERLETISSRLEKLSLVLGVIGLCVAVAVGWDQLVRFASFVCGLSAGA